MRSEIIENHVSDEQGRPAGGTTTGRGFTIEWQNGPLAVDDVLHERAVWLAAAIGRIEFYQRSPFACQENDNALANLIRAAWELDQRTKSRQARGVEGTHTV